MTSNTKKIPEDDFELEKLLSPRCDFRTSPGFKQMVISEAKAMSVCRRRLHIPLFASSVAAAVAILVILTAVHFRDPEPSSPKQVERSFMEIRAIAAHDSLNKESQNPLLAEASQPIQDNKQPQSQPLRKKLASNPESSPESGSIETAGDLHPHPVTEGEMPMISQKRSLDPDEVRVRLLETRRNAEIAYIERMRDEIEANQAYIAQLLNSENVLNTNTYIETSY